MHTYEPLSDEEQDRDDWSVGDLRFRDALDVGDFVRRNPYMGSLTFPETWHLDDDGSLRCYARGTSFDSIRWWVDEPEGLLLCRQTPLPIGPCPARWLIVEPRPTWRFEPPLVDERDAQVFLRLRERLVGDGITLVDAVILDDGNHWWSLHEMTSGTTLWPAPIPAS